MEVVARGFPKGANRKGGVSMYEITRRDFIISSAAAAAVLGLENGIDGIGSSLDN